MIAPTNPSDPHARFTREDAIALSVAEAREWWRIHNRARRDAGLDHYTTLLDPGQGFRVVDSIEEV